MQSGGEWVRGAGGYVRKGSAGAPSTGMLRLPRIPKPLAQFMSATGLSCLVLLSLASQLPGHVWDPSNLAIVATKEGTALTSADVQKFMAAGIKGLPPTKRAVAAEYAFLLAQVTRLEGAASIALGASALYALSLPFDKRASTHLFGAIFGTLVLLMYCDHAGYVDYGKNSFITEDAKGVAPGLALFWAIVTTCFWGSLCTRYAGSRKDD